MSNMNRRNVRYKIRKFLKNKELSKLYKSTNRSWSFVNINAQAYSHWFAEMILENLDEIIKKIKPSSFKGNYRYHDKKLRNRLNLAKNQREKFEEDVLRKINEKNIKPQREKTTAIELINQKIIDDLTFIDYEIPINKEQKDGSGKIDLLAESEKYLYLIELKNSISTETMNRCITEILTYYLQLDLKKNHVFNSQYNKDNKSYKMGIMIFENTNPHRELNDDVIQKLLKRLKIDVFVIKDMGSENIIHSYKILEKHIFY